MENNIANSLTYLGEKFELKLLNEVVGRRILKGKEIYRDIDYGITILPILEEKHFSIKEAKSILKIIKEYYVIYNSIPFYDTLKELVNQKIPSEKTVYYAFLTDIELIPIENKDFVRNSALQFVRQQNFFNAIKEFELKFKSGKAKSFDEGVEVIRKAIEINDISKKPYIFSSDTFEVSDDENRQPIKTGLGKTMDDALSGGPARGDLILYGAGYKVGKTTYGVIQASTAFLEGKTVIYIYFEDDLKTQLIPKFQAHWTGLQINETKKVKNKSYVEQICKSTLKKGEQAGGKLIFKKFDSIESKWSDIENFLYYVETVLGLKIDMLIIDYLECVNPDNHYSDEKWYMAAPEILRKVEHAIKPEKFNCAGVVMMQGKKDTYGVSDVDPTMLGGSVKLLQIAHAIITVGKDEKQMAEGTANVNIWGSRLGIGRAKFENIKYDNARVSIKIEDENYVEDFQKPTKK